MCWLPPPLHLERPEDFSHVNGSGLVGSTVFHKCCSEPCKSVLVLGEHSARWQTGKDTEMNRV